MNHTDITNTITANAPTTKNNPWYPAAIAMALIAAIIIGISAYQLFIHSFHGNFSELLESPQLIKLKQQLKENPKDEELVKQIQQVDLVIRQEFFQQQTFITRGRYILFFFSLVFVLCIKYILDCRTEPPTPPTTAYDAKKTDSRMQTAYYALTVLILATAGATVYLFATPTANPTGDQFASAIDTIHQQQLEQEQAEKLAAEEAQKAKQASFPTDEEIATNWPQFRGPQGQGHIHYDNIPTTWDGPSGKNIAWKTPIPLPGKSSPVVWGNRLFITGANEEKREVYCYDTQDGKLLWQKPVVLPPDEELKNPDAPEEPEVMEDTGFAAPTPVTDGRYVFAVFANGDMVCFDYTGNQVWGKAFGVPENFYGYAVSLEMYQDLVFLQYDQGMEDEGKSILWALNVHDGTVAWKQKRMVSNAWASPVVFNIKGTPQLITLASPWIIAYNPLTGDELWKANPLYGDVASTPVYHPEEGIIIAISPNDTVYGIKVDGTGDVTETHIAWESSDSVPDTTSPLVTPEHFYVTSANYVSCLSIKDGSLLWDYDGLKASFHASPTLVGNTVYLVNDKGVTIMIEDDGSEFKEIGRNTLGEDVRATPAFLDGVIYIRGEKNMYCIRDKD